MGRGNDHWEPDEIDAYDGVVSVWTERMNTTSGEPGSHRVVIETRDCFVGALFPEDAERLAREIDRALDGIRGD